MSSLPRTTDIFVGSWHISNGPGADVSACRDLVQPIRDGADRKRQVADLAVHLGLLLRGKNPSDNRSGVGQEAHLIPKLRQRNVCCYDRSARGRRLRACDKCPWLSSPGVTVGFFGHALPSRLVRASQGLCQFTDKLETEVEERKKGCILQGIAAIPVLLHHALSGNIDT